MYPNDEVGRPEVFRRIIQLLEEYDVEYEHIRHARAISADDTAKVTGLPTRQGVKSILFKSREGYKLVIIRGDNRADFKKLRRHFSTNKLRMATPDEVLAVMSVPVGACYPFGDIAKVDMIVDRTLQDVETMHFSPGTHEDHLIIAFADYVKVTQPRLVDVVLN